MSRTPEVMIDKTRKFFHDVFASAATLAGLVALVSFLTGGSYVFALLVAIGCAVTASNIRFRLVKRVEVGGYDYV